jgi:hypothetical protein
MNELVEGTLARAGLTINRVDIAVLSMVKGPTGRATHASASAGSTRSTRGSRHLSISGLDDGECHQMLLYTTLTYYVCTLLRSTLVSVPCVTLTAAAAWLAVDERHPTLWFLPGSREKAMGRPAMLKL